MDMELYECESLDEFWHAISPIGSIFNDPAYTYLYRGHRDSEWKLSPLAYRKDVIEKYKTGMMQALVDHPDQTFFEFSLLQGYIYYCDQRGLPVPGDSPSFREFFTLPRVMNTHGIDNSAWPLDSVLPLMAAAQHHGIPTRLLDWSHNAMVASYFAAAGAITKATSKDRGGKFAVYGFACNMHMTNGPYRYVHVPGSTSPNIPAQSGCFLLVSNSGRRGEKFTPDVCLEDRLMGAERLKKITLPVVLAGELLMRLYKFGVSAGSIYPGYDGAAKAVLEWNLAQSFTERLG
ncbi:FRG domain-containing protein [Paraburkholderia sp. DHOC27]|uniref:FRG domain-containing protein n=1 Tax=Paraburkholderia sp. DHOC27 TaxID=2303330 RepID=UPI000E3CAE9C|nr:FRG domain-containing protein [Paraburkholderia sp. DHOC27]RFU46976.1 FRG domain-containing protein [Paraburkholderia sp. DHOC27]